MSFFDVAIRGHKDSTGIEEVNYLISSKIASYTRGKLISNGVDTDRIRIVGRGKKEPIDNKDQRKNRRADIVVQ